MPNLKTLRPVVPNKGIELAYRRKLFALIFDMQKSIVYWLSATYRANEHKIAQDDLPSRLLQKTFNDLAAQWQQNFDDGAKKLAAWFASKNKAYTDLSLGLTLKDAGYSVEFKMTEPIRNAYDAIINENVGLIRSIAQEHLSEVQGLVMRSVANGRDLKYLNDELQKRYSITRRRAELISRDQNNKATSVINRTRQQGLGITQAVWVHSTAGKHPRPSHVKAGQDKLVYDLDKGAYLDGKWVWPGTEINCRCVARPLIKGLEDE
ncbi:MAG: phage head morphogenesis protein [Thiobacillus sp.]